MGFGNALEGFDDDPTEGGGRTAKSLQLSAGEYFTQSKESEGNVNTMLAIGLDGVWAEDGI